MKIKHINKKKFNPIKLEITIESEDELLLLYHRLARNIDRQGGSSIRYPEEADIVKCKLFQWFYNHVYENDEYVR